MHTKNNCVNWTCPLRQTSTLNGYRTEMVQVPWAGLKRSSADDCLTGDWVGAEVCAPGRLRVVLADVEDKGRAVRRYHETLARHLSSLAAPPQWLEALDADWPAGRFASVGVVEVDTQRHEFGMVLAGHPHPLLRLSDDGARVLPACRLGLVGVNLGTAETEPTVSPFPTGASLVLVSDGVLDAGVVSRGDAFGVARLLMAIDSAHSASQVAARILEEVNQHLNGAEAEDDVTVVVISRTVAAASMVVSESRFVA